LGLRAAEPWAFAFFLRRVIAAHFASGHFTGSSDFPSRAVRGIFIGVLQAEHLKRSSSGSSLGFGGGAACLIVSEITFSECFNSGLWANCESSLRRGPIYGVDVVVSSESLMYYSIEVII
jgi:hypothetical protein